MKSKKRLFSVKILIIYAVALLFSLFSPHKTLFQSQCFAKTVLSEDFTDYFPPEIFVLFTPCIQAFDSNLNLLNIAVFDFDKTVPQNDEIISIKYVYFPSFLPVMDKEGETDEYRYTNNYSMRFFRSEYSTIAVQVDPNGATTRIFKDDSSIRQCKYDSKERIFYEIVWAANNSKLIRQIYHCFSNDESTVPDYSLEKNFERNIAFLHFYDDNGLYSKTISYELPKTLKDFSEKKDTKSDLTVPPVKEDLKNLKLIEEKMWEYDGENRVIKSTFKKDDRTLCIQRDYSSLLNHPDESIFENDVLKSKKIYSSDTDYDIEVFLENGYSIKSVYVDNLLERNVFYKDGNFIRETLR